MAKFRDKHVEGGLFFNHNYRWNGEDMVRYRRFTMLLDKITVWWVNR